MNKKSILLLLYPIISLHADTVYLHNESDISLHAAPYYTYTTILLQEAQRTSPAKRLPPIAKPLLNGLR